MGKNTLVGILLGTLLTAAISFLLYWKSGEELREEAAQLRRLNEPIIKGMEEAGLAEFTRDASGKLAGIVIKARARRGEELVTATGTVTDATSPEKSAGAERR